MNVRDKFNNNHKKERSRYANGGRWYVVSDSTHRVLWHHLTHQYMSTSKVSPQYTRHDTRLKITTHSKTHLSISNIATRIFLALQFFIHNTNDYLLFVRRQKWFCCSHNGRRWLGYVDEGIEFILDDDIEIIDDDENETTKYQLEMKRMMDDVKKQETFKVNINDDSETQYAFT